ncbi:hypothetical protein Pmani_029949 [Petrolisthes manimaculis]|uniref:Nuclear receptor domain-containing protein n=1 Tax=Petrolisthes manimaculis TaxID=1843537 RepID=A0AAE1TWG8_9EUCA|nr:hypothetical protein Pmani_029949 [Petrolisthes manimaculis]
MEPPDHPEPSLNVRDPSVLKPSHERLRVRLPGVLRPSYERLIRTAEGETAMKRVRVSCGVCLLTRYYSLNRGVTRIAGVVACEACRHFYQRFKRQPFPATCSKEGRCFDDGDVDKNRCKGCWLALILQRCPLPSVIYSTFFEHLSENLKMRMSDCPLLEQDIPATGRGSLGLEMFFDNAWVDVTDKNTITTKTTRRGSRDTDDGSDGDVFVSELDVMSEEMVVGDPPNWEDTILPLSLIGATATVTTDPEDAGVTNEKTVGSTNMDPCDKVMELLMEELDFEILAQNTQSLEVSSQVKKKRKKKKKKKEEEEEEEEEAVVNNNNNVKCTQELLDPNELLKVNQSPSNCRRSQRNKKKWRRREKKKNPWAIYDGEGRLADTGVDLCDCLQGECPGCHFPCQSCGSGKCGIECRVNRCSYYESVEIQGTNIKRRNEYVKR